MIELLKMKSLRFWITTSMAIALVPLTLSAVGGYLLIHNGVIGSFKDVMSRQWTQINPTQKLRLMLGEALVPVDEFIVSGDPVHRKSYRDLRTRIETEFATLDKAMKDEPSARVLVRRAREEWTVADRIATRLISGSKQAASVAPSTDAMRRLHSEIATASDRLKAVFNQIEKDIRADRDAAFLDFERSIWLTAIAGILSLIAIVAGVTMIGRIMAGSVDRLVDGAARFADGQRDHRIEVSVPPELGRVAEEFNHMIGRIRESESVLADRALRDSLTGLPNRRAFDDAFRQLWARIDRLGEHCALLMIDIDHFKHVNDTYGHSAGDDVLRAVAAAMKNNLRPYDSVFRIGGEEFAGLLPNTGRSEAREVAERLRAALAAVAVDSKGRTIRTAVSIGIAFSVGVSGQDELVGLADAALYRAKEGGRNRVVVDGGASRTGRDAEDVPGEAAIGDLEKARKIAAAG